MCHGRMVRFEDKVFRAEACDEGPAGELLRIDEQVRRHNGRRAHAEPTHPTYPPHQAPAGAHQVEPTSWSTDDCSDCVGCAAQTLAFPTDALVPVDAGAEAAGAAADAAIAAANQELAASAAKIAALEASKQEVESKAKAEVVALARKEQILQSKVERLQKEVAKSLKSAKTAEAAQAAACAESAAAATRAVEAEAAAATLQRRLDTALAANCGAVISPCSAAVLSSCSRQTVPVPCSPATALASHGRIGPT
eukprot:SAG11_NODE_4354_length_1935_cov_3.135621_2_plen_252_part_00